MARIRSIHPEQWDDDDFIEMSPLARLLAIGIRNFADDNGVFPWSPPRLKRRCLPGDDCSMIDLLNELLDHKFVRTYYGEFGKVYGQVRNFQRFQSPRRPVFSWVPPDPTDDGYGLHPKYGDQTIPFKDARGYQAGGLKNDPGYQIVPFNNSDEGVSATEPLKASLLVTETPPLSASQNTRRGEEGRGIGSVPSTDTEPIPSTPSPGQTLRARSKIEPLPSDAIFDERRRQQAAETEQAGDDADAGQSPSSPPAKRKKQTRKRAGVDTAKKNPQRRIDPIEAVIAETTGIEPTNGE